MRRDVIGNWLRMDFIRKRSLDKHRIKSMIESAITNMEIVKSVPLTEKSAILVFRETYESIRQLGDAKLWLEGYEPRNHEVSMEILKEMDVQERVRLNQLTRFKNIRNDANYRGFKVTVFQAKEILGFWDGCAKDIFQALLHELNASKL